MKWLDLVKKLIIEVPNAQLESVAGIVARLAGMADPDKFVKLVMLIDSVSESLLEQLEGFINSSDLFGAEETLGVEKVECPDCFTDYQDIFAELH